MPTSLAPGGVVRNPCAYIGYQLDFGPAQLQQLYGTHAGYVQHVLDDSNKLVRERFLLPRKRARTLRRSARFEHPAMTAPVRGARRFDTASRNRRSPWARLRSYVVVASRVDVQGLDDGSEVPSSEPSIGDAMVGVARLAELALAQARMSLIQYRLLHYLRRGRTIQSDLAFQLAVTKQSVTRLVDGLVEKGYITRRVDEGDRRRVIHAITRKGERALDRADELLERFLMSVLQDLDDDADVEIARLGLKFFGRAKGASYKRVRPDGIVPGRKSRRAVS